MSISALHAGSTQLISSRNQIGKALELTGLFLAKPLHIISGPVIRAFATPIRPGKEGNFSSYVLEVVWRVFSSVLCVITAPLTISLALAGACLEKIADLVKKTPYTHLQGTAAEKQEDGNYRLMTLNSCMLWGGLPIPLGGMRPPSDRMDQMAKKIREEDPDVLVMQEMAFDSAYQLYGKIKDKYAHFFTRIGPNPPLMESGLFVASKYPILQSGFIPFPNQLGIKRGAFWIETPKCFVFTTHLEFGHKKDGADKRQSQLKLIWEKIEVFKEKKPCFLLGDFNMDPSHYKKTDLPTKFHDPYMKKHPTITESTSTCTNVINAHICGDKPPQNPWELDDYALLAKGPHDRFKLDTQLVQMYDNAKPYEALTDHRGLILVAESRSSSIFG